MPRAVAVLAVAFLTLLSAATDGQSQTSPPPAASSTALSITSLVDQVTALFPQLEGDVVEAQGQTLTLSIARKTGATPGLVLEAFREGREIRHPKTGAVLGKTEEALGRAVRRGDEAGRRDRLQAQVAQPHPVRQRAGRDDQRCRPVQGDDRAPAGGLRRLLSAMPALPAAGQEQHRSQRGQRGSGCHEDGRHSRLTGKRPEHSPGRSTTM